MDVKCDKARLAKTEENGGRHGWDWGGRTEAVRARTCKEQLASPGDAMCSEVNTDNNIVL